MQTQRYIFNHLSLTRNLALNIPNKVATMRDRKSAFKKKRDFLVLSKTLLFLVPLKNT